MYWIIIAVCALIFAVFPALLLIVNLRRYRKPELPPDAVSLQGVSILIPARNEEENISSAIESVVRNRGVELEVIVLDDHSQDRTASIVQEWMDKDQRVRLIQGPELPTGWNGKQHACFVLSRKAKHPLLVFMDADVRLAEDALLRMAWFLQQSGAALISGLPRQKVVSFMERLIIPLIPFILLAFLPIGRMRRSTHPSYASGIGQLFMLKRDAYEQAGGHEAIRSTRHDGIALPRIFRQAGYLTDLFDATELATCRMYRSASEVWQGFAKNADEGMAQPSLILPVTLLLLTGQVLPIAMLSFAVHLPTTALVLIIISILCIYLPRLMMWMRFHQPLDGVLLHPLGVLVLLAIQWYALAVKLRGKSIAWKGREQDPQQTKM